jgi:sec-independent protein translocase protein TatA
LGSENVFGIQGSELIIILVIGAILLLWGPKKIPELAKGLGQAKGEFDKASKDYVNSAKQAASTKPKEDSSDSSDDALIDTARKLGIDTLGKTRAEISKEIVDKYGLDKKSAANA